MRRLYASLVWHLDAANHHFGICWRPLCDLNDRLIQGKVEA